MGGGGWGGGGQGVRGVVRSILQQAGFTMAALHLLALVGLCTRMYECAAMRLSYSVNNATSGAIGNATSERQADMMAASMWQYRPQRPKNKLLTTKHIQHQSL